MSEFPLSTPETVTAAAQLGRQLGVARESCGLSIVDIARQLKLSPSQVEAIEAGNYQRLPGTVFIRGFIRNYARLVKLDPTPLLAGAEQQLPSSAPPQPELPHSIDIPFPSGRELRWHKYAIALLVLLVPVVVFEFYGEDATEVTVNSRPVVLPQPQVVEEGKAADKGAMPPVSVVVDTTAKPVRAISAPQTKTDAQDKPEIAARTASIEHQPGEHLLKLRFDQESWVEIRDRNGRRIFSQLNPAGTEQAVSGLPPLSLVVGNAAGVRLTHNQQPVNLAPHTKVDVARLTLE